MTKIPADPISKLLESERRMHRIADSLAILLALAIAVMTWLTAPYLVDIMQAVLSGIL